MIATAVEQKCENQKSNRIAKSQSQDELIRFVSDGERRNVLPVNHVRLETMEHSPPRIVNGVHRRPTWGSATEPVVPQFKWRCVKDTQSKLAPGNSLGNKNGRRVESGETIVQISTETRSTLMGMVSQQWIEFLDPITQTMAWVPVTGLASDRRFVQLPNVPTTSDTDGEASLTDSRDDDSFDDEVVQQPNRDTTSSVADRIAADTRWEQLSRIDGSGDYNDRTLPLVNALLHAPLITLADDHFVLQRRRRRAARIAARTSAQAAQKVAARVALGRSNTAATASSVFSVEEGQLDDFLTSPPEQSGEEQQEIDGADEGDAPRTDTLLHAGGDAVDTLGAEGEQSSDGGEFSDDDFDTDSSNEESQEDAETPNAEALPPVTPSKRDEELVDAVAEEILSEIKERHHSGLQGVVLSPSSSGSSSPNVPSSARLTPNDHCQILTGSSVLVRSANGQAFCQGQVIDIANRVLDGGPSIIMATVALDWKLADGTSPRLYAVTDILESNQVIPSESLPPAVGTGDKAAPLPTTTPTTVVAEGDAPIDEAGHFNDPYNTDFAGDADSFLSSCDEGPHCASSDNQSSDSGDDTNSLVRCNCRACV